MRVLVAPDKFKGTLTAREAADAIARGARHAGADVDVAPVADGGEGTMDAICAATGGSIMGVIARGPMGIPVRAHLGRLPDGTGIVELAQASGLQLVPKTDRDPLRATTQGTGELIKGALARRPTKLVIALGGSATVDGGTGLARALGVRFYDAEGKEVAPGGEGLTRIARIDASGIDVRLQGVPMVVAADVTTTLADAAAIYGPQKGASPQAVELLTRGLANLAEVIATDLVKDVAALPGGGAAGGVGAMLAALGGTISSGAQVVLDTIEFEARLAASDLVITGEGKLDASTAEGKAPAVVARAVRAAGKPCVALVGTAEIQSDIFDDVRTLQDHFGGADEAEKRAAAGLQALAARLVSNRR